jgi:hypothetical protein
MFRRSRGHRTRRHRRQRTEGNLPKQRAQASLSTSGQSQCGEGVYNATRDGHLALVVEFSGPGTGVPPTNFRRLSFRDIGFMRRPRIQATRTFDTIGIWKMHPK